MIYKLAITSAKYVTILAKVIIIVNYCYIMTAPNLFEQPSVASLIMPSSLLQFINSLCQTYYNKRGTSSAKTRLSGVKLGMSFLICWRHWRQLSVIIHE